MVTTRLFRSALVLSWLGTVGLGPLACSSEPSSSAGVTHPTMIEVSPGDFLGSLTCADEPGAVRRYVATLFDVTEQGGGAGGQSNESNETSGGAASDESSGTAGCGGFQLPSSLPVSCRASVGFGFVVSGRQYCAEIDAYGTSELEPRGSGTRQMVASALDDGEPPPADAPSVAPLWNTVCRSATAASAQIVPARDCEPLSNQPDPSEPGSLRIETSALLGDLECGSEPGQVDHLIVSLELDDYMGARKLEVACGEAAIYDDLPTGKRLSLYVSAFEAASTQAFAGAECHTLARPATTVVAGCSQLSEVGTLRVDVPAALDSLGLACDATVTDVRVAVAGSDGVRHLPPPDCLQPFDLGFAAGDSASVTVTVTPADGDEKSVNCFNVIEPGRVVVAECTP